jgi:hypothetical protein
MKFVIAAIAFLSILSMSNAVAQNETCRSRAQNCVVKWGGPRQACFEAFRLAACEKTGKYVAPNGNVWPAVRTRAQNE